MLIKNMLYADGIHDDGPAIQEMLDTGCPLVVLPPSAAGYTLGSTLHIHSRQKLQLDPMTVIRMAPQSNCPMLTNADMAAGNESIEIEGGIWDYNNLKQEPNPIRTGRLDYDTVRAKGIQNGYFPDDYFGSVIRFCHVRNLSLRGMTLKDPITFAIDLGFVTYFTVENILFDFNHGNPNATMMDGVHLEGGCRFGHIRNLQGACYDDLVAMNADDLVCGPIEDIEVDGIFCTDCHSAVRMLTTGSPVRRITVSNVFGSFYQYAVAFSHYFTGEGTGELDQITLRGIHAEKAPRYPVYGKEGGYVFPIIWLEDDVHVRHLVIDGLHRREHTTPVELIWVSPKTQVDVLSLCHVTQENFTGTPIPLIHHEGRIGKLFLQDIEPGGDTVLVNRGTIGKIIADEDAAGLL